MIAVFTTRNKLFFKIEPTERELASAWDAMFNNRPARLSRGLGLIALLPLLASGLFSALSILSLLVGITATVLSVIGLRRVDPKADPPVGKRQEALIGMTTGSIAFIGSAVFLAFKIARLIALREAS